MNDQTARSPKDIYVCLESIAGCIARELREQSCERGIDVGAFFDWMSSDSGIDTVPMALEIMLDQYIVSAGKSKP